MWDCLSVVHVYRQTLMVDDGVVMIDDVGGGQGRGHGSDDSKK
jgi:hypothetical protein